MLHRQKEYPTVDPSDIVIPVEAPPKGEDHLRVVRGLPVLEAVKAWLASINSGPQCKGALEGLLDSYPLRGAESSFGEGIDPAELKRRLQGLCTVANQLATVWAGPDAVGGGGFFITEEGDVAYTTSIGTCSEIQFSEGDSAFVVIEGGVGNVCRKAGDAGFTASAEELEVIEAYSEAKWRGVQAAASEGRLVYPFEAVVLRGGWHTGSGWSH